MEKVDQYTNFVKLFFYYLLLLLISARIVKKIHFIDDFFFLLLFGFQTKRYTISFKNKKFTNF